MKHIVIITLAIIMVVISVLIGSICYLWKFSKRDFHAGKAYLADKIGFVEFLDKHMSL
jgi:uncharacterized protein YpmB